MPFRLPSAACLEIKGYKTVMIATENIPSGRFATLHEKVRAVVLPAPRFSAKKLSTLLFICTAPRLSIIGIIILDISRTALFLKLMPGLYFKPVFFNHGSCIAISRTDPSITPIAILAIPIFFASSTTKTMEIIFMIMGATAETAKILWLFKMLVIKPDMLITTREKIIILFIEANPEISMLLPEIFESSEPMG